MGVGYNCCTVYVLTMTVNFCLLVLCNLCSSMLMYSLCLLALYVRLPCIHLDWTLLLKCMLVICDFTKKTHKCHHFMSLFLSLLSIFLLMLLHPNLSYFFFTNSSISIACFNNSFNWTLIKSHHVTYASIVWFYWESTSFYQIGDTKEVIVYHIISAYHTKSK